MILHLIFWRYDGGNHIMVVLATSNDFEIPIFKPFETFM